VEARTPAPETACHRRKSRCKADFNKPFPICTDASRRQSGAAALQEGKSVAFRSRKLNPAQARRATTERELLSAAETLKVRQRTLLGQEVEVLADQKMSVHKRFSAERAARWRLLSEEFQPELTCAKGGGNVVAGALAQLGQRGHGDHLCKASCICAAAPRAL